MFKKRVSMLTAIMFLFSLFPIFSLRAYGYQNTSYFNDLKVGLVSMYSAGMTLTLNGDYLVNGQGYPSGTSLKLAISGTSLTMNSVLQSQIELKPLSSSCLLAITSGTTTNKYMGSLVFGVSGGKILPINMIDMENYLKGVVGYEMSDYFPIESLKAQAVTARNYAMSRIGWEAAKGYDFDDTINYQVYKGYNPSYANVINAVDQTRGQVLLYSDKLVETLYSAWHGGVSENSENVWGNYVPYLRSVVDTFENNPWPNGNVVLTNAAIKSTLTTKGYLLSTDNFIRLDLPSITKYASGRVSNINIIYSDIQGTLKSKSVTKDATRTFLSLPSNLYTVTYDAVSGAYTFSGRGYGHGLGMSQIGAKNRAAAGQAYSEILSFYYQNAYIQNLILKASLVNVAISRTSILTGDSITVQSTATCGNGKGNLFKYSIIKDGNPVFTSGYTNNTTFDYTPDQPGQYTVQVYVKDAFSTSEFDDTKTVAFTAYSQIQLDSFNLDKAKTLIGQQITASVSTSGGSTVKQYKYEVLKAGVVLMTRDYSTENQFTYNPAEVGDYMVTMYVRDELSTKEFDLKQTQSFQVLQTAKLSTVATDKQQYLVGQTLALTAAAEQGTGSYLYRYSVQRDGVVIAEYDYSTVSNLEYKLEEAGVYRLKVYVKDAISTNEYDDTRDVEIQTYQMPTMKLLTSANEIVAGDSVTYGIEHASGSGVTEYRFTVQKDGLVLTDTGYSGTSSFTFQPTDAGAYQVEGMIRDGLSGNSFDEKSTLSLIVYKPEIVSASANGNFFEGKVISLQAVGTGGSSQGISYRYEISQGGLIKASSSWSTSTGFNFTPTISGDYTVKIYGKDGLSVNPYDCLKQFDLKINSRPLYLSKLPLSQGMTGGDVLALQNALIRLGYDIGTPNGSFGKSTKNAVISFQKSKSLSADGIVGNITYGALNEALMQKVGSSTMNF